MAKFKVGDKVRVIENGIRYKSYSSDDGCCVNSMVPEMLGMCGKIVTISYVTSSGQYSIKEDDSKWRWTDEMFSGIATEQPRREFIVIRRSGAETIAELRHDREVIKSAKATCAPSDTFDFETGAKIAFDRLMGRKADKVMPRCKIPESAPQPAHRFKVGDRVQTDRGIATVIYVDDEPDGYLSSYLVCGEKKWDTDMWIGCVKDKSIKSGVGCEWFNVYELSPAPAPEPPKFYTGKVVMIGCDYPDRNHLINHLFEFKDGKYIGHEMRGIMFHHDPYTSFDYIKSVHTASKWIEVKE